MKKIKVRLNPPYDICIGDNIAFGLKRQVKKLRLGNYGVAITNKTIYSLHKSRILKIFAQDKDITFKFHILPDTEKAKSFKSVRGIIDKVASASYKKRVFFVCLGGGVIGDLGAFTASIYKRGRPVIQMPTTLLSQIDSAIGGKTAIDLRVAKNMVGTFWQPSLVLSDFAFLKTLKTSQIREGLAEAIKYGLIKDRTLFLFLKKHYKALLAKKKDKLLWLIHRCAAIKQRIVETDEREEKGVRTILNFGHTIGHAIEASSYYRISHGKAVALGIIAALYISKKEGLLRDKTLISQVTGMIKDVGLPANAKLKISRVIKALKKDKKFVRGKTRMVLLKNVESATVKEDIKIADIKQGLISITG